MTHTGPLDRLVALQSEMQAWRRDLHAHPEIAFQEERTSRMVAEKLAAWGLEVHTGLARTGVVGTLRGRRPGDRAIGLRADMDALPIQETNGFAHRSRHDGRMHACGHDGHTAMLLGAAKALAEAPDFAGTVQFIFQPAEEGEGGGRVMVEEGLFERFPVESVWGLHNWPGLEVGRFDVRVGPIMAAFDTFDITLTGHGTHGAMPHLGTDVITAGAAVVTALQTIVARTVNPQDAAVVSVTQIHGGDAYNVIPTQVVLRGTTRALSDAVQDTIERRMRDIVQHVAAAHEVTGALHYQRRYPATVNSPAETARAVEVMRGLVGAAHVDPDGPPTMGGEDFAFMLRERPGCYVRLGAGPGQAGCGLHNPGYDFNDAILPLGASYWVRLVHHLLGDGAAA
ncbi:M20 aminoacylase family protein [Roseospira goensis]|uniref:Hippurate hydrolase n=1 Tax=Roseospira goensis TaxID=391922 RepID=A0A7W6S173_9PROT|nr:M20 aminoacylase family protein [Roseospira goensis]MBB4287003.1 hippurate hydrolase [Roseospira goensis]